MKAIRRRYGKITIRSGDKIATLKNSTLTCEDRIFLDFHWFVFWSRERESLTASQILDEIEIVTPLNEILTYSDLQQHDVRVTDLQALELFIRNTPIVNGSYTRL